MSRVWVFELGLCALGLEVSGSGMFYLRLGSQILFRV